MSDWHNADEIRTAEAIRSAIQKANDTLMVQMDAAKKVTDPIMHNLRIGTDSCGRVGVKNPPTMAQVREIARDTYHLRLLQNFAKGTPQEIGKDVLKHNELKLMHKTGLVAIESDREPLHERVHLEFPPFEREEEEEVEEPGFIGKVKSLVWGGKKK